MTKATTLTISIPFPAWDGIRLVGYICGELRRNEMLRGMPLYQNPRRITVQEKGKQERYDDVKVVQYWFTNGRYAIATLGGHDDDHYGMSWRLVSLRLRWKGHHVLVIPFGEERDDFWVEDKLELQLNAEQIEAIRLTSYLRRHLRDYEGRPNFAEARAQLAEAEVISNTIIAALAGPIREALERRRPVVVPAEEGVEVPEYTLTPPDPEWKSE